MKRIALRMLFLAIFVFTVACQGTDEESPPLSTADEAGETADTAADDTNDRSDDSESDENEVQTVKLAVYDWEFGRYQDIADAFSEENPNIQIELVSVEEILDLDPGGGGRWPEDARDRLARAADINQSFFSPEGIERGLVLDLAPLLANDPDLSANDFYADIIENQRYNGGLYLLPAELNFDFIFYRKDILDEQGLEHPKPGWTWTDLLEIAQATTIREGDGEIIWGFVSANDYYFDLIRAHAGPLVDYSAEPQRPLLDSDETVAAATFLADMVNEYEVMPYFERPEFDDPENFSPPQGYQLIEDGQAVMWNEWSGSYGWRSENADGELGVLPMPVNNPDDRSTSIYTNGYAISGGTTKPQAAWEFLKFLVAQPPSDFGFGGPVSLPALKQTAESSGFWDDVDPEFAAAVEFALTHGSYFEPVSFNLFEPLDEALIEILQNRVDPAIALADAQAAAEEEAAQAALEDDEPAEIEEFIVEESAASPASEDAVTIRFTASGGIDGLKPFRDLAERFTEENPSIVVDVRQPDFTSNRFTLANALESADCVQFFPAFQDEDSLAAILPIEPLLDADLALSRDDFYPLSIDQYSYQGQLWGLPGEILIPTIQYDKDLFDEVGIAYPQPDWTIDQFLEMAVALSTAGDETTRQYGFVPDAYEIGTFRMFVEQLGGGRYSDLESPPTIVVNDPETIAAVRWYIDLNNEYDVKPQFDSELMSSDFNAYETRRNLIDSGRAGMWVATGSWEEFTADKMEDRNIGVVPLPVNVDGSSNRTIYSSGYFISATTDYRQQCWEWIKFLTGNSVESGTLPARLSLVQSDEFRAEKDEEVIQAYEAAVATATSQSPSLQIAVENSWLGISSIWLSQAFDIIMNEEVEVEIALNEAQQKIDNYRACIIQEEAFTLDREAEQKACLKEVDDTLPPYIYEVSDS
ncbi:MAG: extracellular solute-binding protein [Ardenticatenaceae bacterium]|nr:extracellular solute-binding protein [Ardenticatenaceae bacterium]